MPCVYCGGELVEFRSEPIERLDNDSMFSDSLKKECPFLTHSKCKSCGSILATDARVKDEKILLETYTNLESDYWDGLEKSSNLKFFSSIEKYINPTGISLRICDVGCGNGSFLKSLSSCWSKFGVEPGKAEQHLVHDKSINFFSGLLKDSCFAKNSMDIIIYNDVFEHLINPIEEINVAKQFLSENGRIVILTGNATSFNAKLAGKAWVYPRFIGHITVASEIAIRKALERSGFLNVNVMSMNHPCSVSLPKWLLYIALSKITGSKETIFKNRGCVPLFHDHMLVIASR
jgi:2-polyprenyl-3-methyl-5-hydroxy-6-metoxy-1,4-benzoquinol methylase